MWKGAVTAYFQVLSWILSAETAEGHKKSVMIYRRAEISARDFLNLMQEY
jgi:hypothetical protein